MLSQIKHTLKSFLFTYSTKSRERGDDTGIFLYGVFWVYVGTMLVFTQDASLEAMMKFYAFFDIPCLVFIILHLWRSSNKHIDIIRLPEVTSMIPWVVACMIALFGIGEIIDSVMGVASSSENIAFYYLRIIETEELVYRGLALEVFILLDKRKINEELTPEMSTLKLLFLNKFFIIGSICSSILFGIAHNNAYSGNIAPMIYLMFLGLLACFLRYKWGIVASIILHAINNYAATSQPDSIFLLLLVIEGIAAFLAFISHMIKQREKR